MIIKAEQKLVRMSPRKLRLLADGIRALSLENAFAQLQALNKAASLPLKKTLRQAQANAINVHKQNPQGLTIKEIQITEGPTYKRWQPVSRGRAHSIFKRTSNIRILLESTEVAAPQPAPEEKAIKRGKIKASVQKKTTIPSVKVRKENPKKK